MCFYFIPNVFNNPALYSKFQAVVIPSTFKIEYMQYELYGSQIPTNAYPSEILKIH
jgi:hypothetical protein